MKTFYHSADLDGMCSGAIVKYRYPETELIGINYGDPFPWGSLDDRQERVFMVDFSLQPFSDMVQLASMVPLSWIDHHKSAIIEWEEYNRPFEPLDINSDYAACELTWKNLFPKRKLPTAVYWLGRYDIWKHEGVPGALEFQYGMRLHDTRPENQEFWTGLFDFSQPADRIRKDGEILLEYEILQNARFAAAFCFETELDGLRCIACNKGFTNSKVFDSVYDPEKHDAMLSFCWRGGKWTVSLYSTKPEVDCSVICKARGGGGHKGAAGFQTAELDFL